MEAKAITQIGLVQAGIVFGGYLAATAAIKIGFGSQPDFAGRPTPASVDFIRSWGLLPLVIPVTWVLFAAIFRKRETRNSIMDYIPIITGIVFILLLMLGYCYATAEGFFGPPIMDVQAIQK